MTERELRAALDEATAEIATLRRENQGLRDAITLCRSDCADLGTALDRVVQIRRSKPRTETVSYSLNDVAL